MDFLLFEVAPKWNLKSEKEKKTSSKLKLTNCLLLISGLAPSNPTNPVIKVSFYTVFHILSSVFLGFYLLQGANTLFGWDLELLMNRRFFPPRGQNGNRTLENGEALNQPPMGHHKRMTELVKVVLTLGIFAVVTLNMALRILVLTYFKELQRIYKEFRELNAIAQVPGWSKNEILFLTLMVLNISQDAMEPANQFFRAWTRSGISLWEVLSSALSLIRAVFCQQFPSEVVQLILLQFVEYVAQNLESIGVDSTRARADAGAKTTLRIVRKYFQWASFWKKSSNIIGAFIFIIFANHLITANVSGFTWLTSANDISPFDSMTMLRLLMLALSILKIFNMANAGRCLEISVGILLERLAKEDVNAGGDENHLVADSVLSAKLQIFLSHAVKSGPFQLNALKFFTITRAGLTAVASVIVTYQVILLQFQLSNAQALEANGDGGGSTN